MKVRKTEGVDAKQLEESRQAKKLDRQNARSAQAAALADTQARIELSLGRAINNELDATAMEEERREKIERIKSQIEKGTYRPSAADVANAVGQELVMEILTGGVSATDD